MDYCWQRCVGVDNWSRLHTRLVSLCPEFPKDSEACRKKWSSIYNDYKEDKAINMRSGSDRSDKCRWYQLVDDFMSDRTHVVSHAHANAINHEGPNKTAASDTFTADLKGEESSSKISEPRRKDDVLLERCIGEMKESRLTLMEGLKASDDMKFIEKHTRNNAKDSR